ncbi:MAG: efflux RND transporter periplasmic adaptor subunit [Immundisolibacteraceae bacterium]|nr:efflux RND transporter periplasmic adaptor subunit [Immundisolibacteraceae bacterium]
MRRFVKGSLAIFTLILLTGCDSAPSSDPIPRGERAMPVIIETASTETVLERVPAVGNLLANESVVMRAEIAGLISTIGFIEGSEVSKGQLLIELNPEEHLALVEQTAASTELARLNFERAQGLRHDSMISQQGFDEAQTQLKVSRATLRRHRSLLTKTRLLAPFSGTIGLRHVSPGAYIQPGQDLVNLEDIDPIKVEFKLSERYASALAIGQQIELRVDALPGKIFSGLVYAIDPRLDPRTRSFALRAKVDNSNQKLRPGMFTRLNLIVNRREQSVVVSEQAIWPQGEKAFVYRLVDNRAKLIQVEIGERFDGKVELRSGINIGDQIIISGQMKIRDGSLVTAVGQSQQPAG